MDRKHLSLTGIMFTVLAFGFMTTTANAQYYPMNQAGGECCCDDDCCSRFLRCIWGQMACDGTGGRLRIYGYPNPTCCTRCCPYPVYGMGYECQLNAPPCQTYYCPQPVYGYHSRNSKGKNSNSTSLAACFTATPLPCCSVQPGAEMARAVSKRTQTKAVTIPTGLKLASKPVPLNKKRTAKLVALKSKD